jgi:hypothetical protein
VKILEGRRTAGRGQAGQSAKSEMVAHFRGRRNDRSAADIQSEAFDHGKELQKLILGAESNRISVIPVQP